MDTKEEILKVAKKKFYTDGFHATTARSIARECGIVHSNLFYHYSSMNDIALVIMQEFVETSRQAVLSHSKNLTPIELYIAYTIVDIYYMYYDKKFADLCFEIPEILSDAVYRNAIEEIFPDLNLALEDDNSENIFAYLDFQAVITTQIRTIFLVKKKNLKLNIKEVVNYILELKRRIWDIDDDTFEKAIAHSTNVVKKVNYEELNIFKK
ncbi:TetR/AcrR family transcriptional regulator [Eubacteriaceae bacterium ES2]|nr:TetR/AcrR family transcriptional regulator [Eubacteriaceae bacterium ES2]